VKSTLTVYVLRGFTGSACAEKYNIQANDNNHAIILPRMKSWRRGLPSFSFFPNCSCVFVPFKGVKSGIAL
jgi:hypothetical protein